MSSGPENERFLGHFRRRGGRVGAMKQTLCHTVSYSLMAVTVKLATVNYSMSGKACLVIMTLILTGAKVQSKYKIVSCGVGVMMIRPR
jgi:hypothetical protein